MLAKILSERNKSVRNDGLRRSPVFGANIVGLQDQVAQACQTIDFALLPDGFPRPGCTGAICKKMNCRRFVNRIVHETTAIYGRSLTRENVKGLSDFVVQSRMLVSGIFIA
jgi:hypothetical protein